MLDGFDVLRWLKEESSLKLLPVTVLTSSDAEKDVERAYELGANSYLVKPSRFEEYQTLVEAIRDYWLQLNRSPALS
jgi:DNA-binding response OmpR family regulator